MLNSFLLLLLATQVAPPVVITPTAPPAPAFRRAPIVMVGNTGTAVENIRLRVLSADGVLWEGSLRVSSSQNASYQQNLSQASSSQCPPATYYDRTERSHLNISVHAQHNQISSNAYRLDVSWARPVQSQGCGESGLRTVQINQTVQIAPGETSVIAGDAGLRVQLTRGR